MSPWIEGNSGMEETEGSLTDIVASLRGKNKLIIFMQSYPSKERTIH